MARWVRVRKKYLLIQQHWFENVEKYTEQKKKPERINAFVFVLHILRGGILAGLFIVETLLG